jgi:hypothetical protein
MMRELAGKKSEGKKKKMGKCVCGTHRSRGKPGVE